MDDAYSTNEDTAFTATLGIDNLLQNDSDVDGDTLAVNTTPIVDVTDGTLVLNADGTFTYTPDANFNGTDGFTYEINDGNGGTAKAIRGMITWDLSEVPEEAVEISQALFWSYASEVSDNAFQNLGAILVDHGTFDAYRLSGEATKRGVPICLGPRQFMFDRTTGEKIVKSAPVVVATRLN